jgi:hypothetical protein
MWPRLHNILIGIWLMAYNAIRRMETAVQAGDREAASPSPLPRPAGAVLGHGVRQGGRVQRQSGAPPVMVKWGHR